MCLNSATKLNYPKFISLFSAPNSFILMFCYKPSQPYLKPRNYLTLLLSSHLSGLICESRSLTSLNPFFIFMLLLPLIQAPGVLFLWIHLPILRPHSFNYPLYRPKRKTSIPVKRVKQILCHDRHKYRMNL